MPTHDKDLETTIRTARAGLVFLRPYLSHAILAFVLVETPRVPTMAVDQYWRLYYNPTFWRTRYPNKRALTDALIAVLYHEAGHRLRRHNEAAARMGVTTEYGSIAHIAMECEINDDHEDEVKQFKDIPQLPVGAIYPSTYAMPDHLTWEQYYDLLLQRAGTSLPSDCASPDCGSGAHGQERAWEIGSPDKSGVEGIEEADARDIERMVAHDIADYAQRHGRGTVPGNWASWSSDVLRIKPVRWDHELACGLRWTLSSVSGQVYHSYHRPSRRQQATPDFIMPSMRRPLPHVAVVGDTSASMAAVLNAVPMLRSVITDVCRSLGAEVTFLSTDAEVHSTQNVCDGRAARLIGGGGTYMGAGIEAAMRLRPPPSAIVVVTDCETLWPAKRPPIPVVIAAVGSSLAYPTPSWARTIRITPAEAT